jgi:hypothetical protein
MQQVGGSVGTAVLSTVAASATSSYLAAHGTLGQAAAIAATHGYVVVFIISSAAFGVGALACAAFFPSRARIAEIRAAAGENTPPPHVEDVLSEIVVAEL